MHTITTPTTTAPAVSGTLADAWTPDRAAARFEQDGAQIAMLRRQLETANAPITSGEDPRLVDFWVRAGEIASTEGFCSEYDRLAEEMGGVPRERDWSVEMDVTVTVRITTTATTRDRDDAYRIAVDNLDSDDIVSAMRYQHIEWDSEEVSVTAE